MNAFIFAAFAAFGHTSAVASTWAIDPGHASASFRINHLGFSNVQGLIPGVEGVITLDDANPEKSTFDVKVPVANLTTGNAKRDEHLRSPDFFNQKKIANIELKSKSVKKKGADFEITGDLSMHGVTKPLTFVFKQGKTGKDPWGGERTGGETSFKIKRTDFGMKTMSNPGEIGDEVEITVALEAVKK